MKIVGWISALVVAAALLGGCGGGADETATAERPQGRSPDVKRQTAGEGKRDRTEKLRTLSVTLGQYEGPENVGILMAQERDYFKDVGLKVFVSQALAPAQVQGYVDDMVADLGVTHQPQVVMAREDGDSIIAVGSLISRSTAALISLPEAGIRDIADLKGKTIGTPGLEFQESFLESILAQAGLKLDEVKVKPVDYDLVPALASGRVDAVFGGSSNIEGVALEARRLDPVVLPVRRLGIPSYDELVLIARPEDIAEDPQTIRDFMAALARGTAAAIEDPGAAVAVIRKAPEANLELNRRATEAQLRATLPLLSRSGHMSSPQAGNLVDWMYQEGMIERKLPLNELFTNELRPQSASALP